MSKKSTSLAMGVVTVGLLIQVFGLLYGVTTTVGWSVFFSFQAPAKEIPVLIVLIGSLALLAFVRQGRKWAVIASIPVQLILLLPILPAAIQGFGNLADLNSWFLAQLLMVTALVAVAFGVVAVRELSGKSSPASWRHEGGGLSRQGAVLMAVLVAFGSLLTLAAAVAANPPAAQTFQAVPETSLTVDMHEFMFAPATVEIAAGKTTAIWLTNSGGVIHDFTVPDLGIEQVVPPKGTSLVLITPEKAGTYHIVCEQSGHAKAGMMAMLIVK
jgi:plastocyanin